MSSHPNDHTMAFRASPRFSSSASSRRQASDGGFTLIELMVVVLVIAILLAIAIPTFLGARERSQDRAAQSSLRNALSAAKVLYAEDGTYFSARLASGLEMVEPRLSFQNSPTNSTGPDVISISAGQCSNGVNTTQTNCMAAGSWTASTNTCTGATGRNNTSQLVCVTPGEYSRDYSLWSAAAWSESETCWYIRDAAEALGAMSGTSYGSDDTLPQTSCIGARARQFHLAPDSKW